MDKVTSSRFWKKTSHVSTLGKRWYENQGSDNSSNLLLYSKKIGTVNYLYSVRLEFGQHKIEGTDMSVNAGVRLLLDSNDTPEFSKKKIGGYDYRVRHSYSKQALQASSPV